LLLLPSSASLALALSLVLSLLLLCALPWLRFLLAFPWWLGALLALTS
jgi:hypothetical protein